MTPSPMVSGRTPQIEGRVEGFPLHGPVDIASESPVLHSSQLEIADSGFPCSTQMGLCNYATFILCIFVSPCVGGSVVLPHYFIQSAC